MKSCPHGLYTELSYILIVSLISHSSKGMSYKVLLTSIARFITLLCGAPLGTYAVHL